LIPNSIPEKLWSYILVDFITKLLLAQEYNSILVVVDRLTNIITQPKQLSHYLYFFSFSFDQITSGYMRENNSKEIHRTL